MAKITIRRVDPKVWQETLVSLQLLCLPECEPLRPDSEGDGWWWLAFSGTRPIAFAGLKPSVRVPKSGYLARAGVHPDYRGKGIQRRLIRVRERFARVRQWEWMFSDTIQNPVSSNNLIKCGYKIFEPSTPWGNEGALYFRKNIA